MGDDTRFRVLLIDDEPMVAEVLGTILTHCGYDAKLVSPLRFCRANGNGTCPLATGHACADAILSDIRMPEIDGMSLMKQLSARGCHIRQLALMSGFWASDLRNEAEERGIKVFEKPFAHHQLLTWLETGKELLRPGRVLVDLDDSTSTADAQPIP